MTDEQHELDPQVYLDSAVNSLTSQLASGDALDAKAGTMLATALAEVALVAAVVTLRKPHTWAWLYVVSGGAGIAAAVVGLVGSLWVRTWETFPTAKAVYEQFDGTDDSRTQVGAAVSNAFKANKGKVRRKALAVVATQALVLVQTIAFAVGAALTNRVL